MIESRHWSIAPHDEFSRNLRLIEEVYQSAFTQNPKSLRIVGVAGVGKSLLLQKFTEMRPRKHDEDGINVPCLLVSIPARPTEKTLLTELLHALGDPHPTWGTGNQMRLRLLVSLKSAQTKIILVDEVQHFLTRMQRSTRIAECADTFKTLINDFHGGLVMCGARSSRQLFQLNSQLRSRIPAEVELRPFDWEASNSRKMFCAVLKAQFPIGSENDLVLLEPENACRIWYATDGIPRAMSKLILELKKLTKENVPINLWTLSTAFKIAIWPNATEERNPFSKEFQWTRLNLSGEPYQPDPIEGDNHALG